MQTQQTQTKPSYTYVEADIFTLSRGDLGEHWPTIIKFLSMIDRPDWTTDQVFEDLKDGRAQLWGIADDEIKGIWITRIEQTAKARYGLVWIAAGRGLELGVSRFLACTEPWFREMQCEYIEIEGRRGWQKVLPGFKEHAVILRKRL